MKFYTFEFLDPKNASAFFEDVSGSVFTIDTLERNGPPYRVKVKSTARELEGIRFLAKHHKGVEKT